MRLMIVRLYSLAQTCMEFLCYRVQKKIPLKHSHQVSSIHSNLLYRSITLIIIKQFDIFIHGIIYLKSILCSLEITTATPNHLTCLIAAARMREIGAKQCLEALFWLSTSNTASSPLPKTISCVWWSKANNATRGSIYQSTNIHEF